MLVAELFFGRNIRGRGPLSEAEWRAFAAEIVTPELPRRLHGVRRRGAMAQPGDRHGSRASRPRSCSSRAKRTPDLAARLSAVIEAYKTRFRQQSVGIITREFLRRVLTRGCRLMPSPRPGSASGAATATP